MRVKCIQDDNLFHLFASTPTSAYQLNGVYSPRSNQMDCQCEILSKSHVPLPLPMRHLCLDVATSKYHWILPSRQSQMKWRLFLCLYNELRCRSVRQVYASLEYLNPKPINNLSYTNLLILLRLFVLPKFVAMQVANRNTSRRMTMARHQLNLNNARLLHSSP